MKTQISIEVPFIITASDYHEFKFLLETFNSIGMKVKMKELSPEDLGLEYGYFAIYYRTKLPEKEEFKELVRNFVKKERL